MIAESQTFLPWWFAWLLIAVATVFLVATTMAVFYNQLGEVAGRRATLQGAPFAVLIVLLVALLLPVIDTDRFATWFLPLFVVLYAWSLIISRRRKQQAGAVLLDIGGREHRKGQVALYSVVLVFMLISAAVGIAAERWQGVGLPVLLIVQNAISLWDTQRRNSVRENGLWFDNNFTRWDQMRAYHWEADRPTTLTIHLKKPRLWLRTASFPIPPQHRDDVARLFAERVPRATVPSSSATT